MDNGSQQPNVQIEGLRAFAQSRSNVGLGVIGQVATVVVFVRST